MKTVKYNPYQFVDFETFQQNKGAFHVHHMKFKKEEDGTVIFADGRTLDPEGNEIQGGDSEWDRNSGNNHPDYENSEGIRYGRNNATNYADDTVDQYYEKGYKILAISDKNGEGDFVVYPFDIFHRNAEELNMLSVRGLEVVNGHHRITIFTDLAQFEDAENIENTFTEIGNKHGLSWFAHSWFYDPGDFDHDVTEEQRENLGKFYAENIIANSHVVGLEVNAPHNSYTWDYTLMELNGKETCYGFGDDDAIFPESIGQRWTVFLMPELNNSNLRTSIKRGASYVQIDRDAGGWENVDRHTTNQKAPNITNIKVEDEKIKIEHDGVSVSWISDNQEVYVGNELSLDTFGLGSYVRAIIYSEESNAYSYTQPFLLEEKGETVIKRKTKTKKFYFNL